MTSPMNSSGVCPQDGCAAVIENNAISARDVLSLKWLLIGGSREVLFQRQTPEPRMYYDEFKDHFEPRDNIGTFVRVARAHLAPIRIASRIRR